jgi:HAD superfamily hydrolase (TIGR01509 family)
MTLLIYDCDGVLVDSEPLAGAGLAELLTALGHPMTAAECIREFGGRSLNDVLRRSEQILGRPVPQSLGQQAGERLLARFRRELKPVAGTAEAVASLPYRRCVASSSAPKRLKLSLELTGLAPLFGEYVYSATQVANGKPAPDLFLFAAGCVGESPSQAIVIEDSVLGIVAARAAGMAAIGFAGASHVTADIRTQLAAASADVVVTSMAELPAAIEALVARQKSGVGTYPRT